MTTWEEIRDEVAGMLADGQPLEDVLAKLEKRKNEMAKANLIAVMDEMKKPKPMTNEEWRKTCSAEEFAEALTKVVLNIVSWNNDPRPSEVRNILKAWLKQPHNNEATK